MNPLFNRLGQGFAVELLDLDATQTQLRLRRHPEKWSIQQTAEHLLLTYLATTTGLEARIAKGSATSVRPTVANRINQMVVLTVGYLPHGRVSPALAMPATDNSPLSGAELVASASAALATMDEVLSRAETRFGRAPVMKHIALGPLTLRQWRKFQLVHGLHHFAQIRAIRRDYGL